MTQQIVLVRHGRSAHAHKGSLDAAAFHRWREAYEAAGIHEHDQPPPELRALAAQSAVIVASPAARAVQSAQLLAPHSDITTSPLLHELTLPPPNLGPLRLPLLLWALAYGIRGLIRPHFSPAEAERSHEAAQWLTTLAGQHTTVLAITHASFRSLLLQRLLEQGWHCETSRRRASHWSAWSLRR